MTPTPPTSWDLAGRLTVGLDGLDARQRRAVAEQLDPFEPTADLAADVTLSAMPLVSSAHLRELQRPAKDGRTTARSADGELLVRCADGWVSVPAPEDAALVRLEVGASPTACWADVVRPALHMALHRRTAVAVHASAVEVDGAAVLVAGWSESGKTEVGLALVERGARFLSDKWTVIAPDREASAFPVHVGVRGWALPALPTLRHTMPRAARTQLAAARALDVSTRAARSRSGGGRVTTLAAQALTRLVELGDRAGVSPSALRRAYGDTSDPTRRVPLRAVVVLVTASTPHVVVEQIDVGEAAVRLARSAAYERRVFFDLQERGAYAGLAERAGARDASTERETQLLRESLSGVRVLRVACPFPGDPRRVVDSLGEHL